MEEMQCLFLFTCSSLPPMFTLVAASISHFLTAAIKFSCFSSNKFEEKLKIGFHVFLFLFFYLAFPRLCRNLNLVGRKTRLCCCCCCFFSSLLKSGWPCDLSPKYSLPFSFRCSSLRLLHVIFTLLRLLT